MKRNNKSAIALIALSLLALSSGAAFAGHHWVIRREIFERET